jgi:hypothetical protein
MADYDKVEEALQEAKGIAWDTCHKIYVLMDDEQMALMKTYGYDPLISVDEMNPSQMFDKIVEWYEDSCGLRFVEAVSTNHEDPNAGFEVLIGQFEDQEDEDEDEDDYEEEEEEEED